MEEKEEVNIQEELRQDKYDPKITQRESLKNKLIRGGLITAAVVGGASLLKGRVGNRTHRVIDDLVQVGATSALMVGLSQDDDTLADVGVAGLFFAGAHGLRFAKSNLLQHNMTHAASDISQTYRYAQKAQDVYKAIALASMNIKDNVSDTLKDAAVKSVVSVFTNESESTTKSVLVGVANFGKELASALIAKPYQEIKEKGLIEGAKSLGHDLVNSRIYEEYKNSDANQMDLKSVYNKAKNVEIKSTAPTGLETPFDTDKTKGIKGIIKSIAMPLHGANNDEIKLKKMMKYQTIEKDTRFLDMAGIYTKIEKAEDGTEKVTANISRLLEDKANFGETLNIAANMYKTTTKDIDVSEKGFVDFLHENGMSNIVEKFYKKDNYISYGEVSDMFNNLEEGKTLSQTAKDYLYFGKSSSLIDDVDYNNNIVGGLKNNDILKNFAFTNVVEKTASGSIIDKTAFDGRISTLKLLGTVESNSVGHYKSPLEATLSKWNPFTLIQSESRIKNRIHNDIMEFTHNEHTIVNEGQLIKFNFFTEYDKAQKKDIVTRLETHLSDSHSYRVDFKSATHDLFDSSFSVAKKNDTIKDFKAAWDKADGVKEKFSVLTRSQYNPFAIRYDKHNDDNEFHFRRVLNHEGNFKEGSAINSFVDFVKGKKYNIDQATINSDNKLFAKSVKETVTKDAIDLFASANPEDPAIFDDFLSFVSDKYYEKANKVFNAEIRRNPKSKFAKAKNKLVNKYKSTLETVKNDLENSGDAILELQQEKNAFAKEYASFKFDALDNAFSEYTDKSLSIFQFKNKIAAEENILTELSDPLIVKGSPQMFSKDATPAQKNFRKMTAFSQTFKELVMGNEDYLGQKSGIDKLRITAEDMKDFFMRFSVGNKKPEEAYMELSEAKQMGFYLDFIHDFNTAKRTAKKAVYNEVAGNAYKVSENNMEYYFSQMEATNKHNFLYNIHQQALGFEFSKVHAKYSNMEGEAGELYKKIINNTYDTLIEAQEQKITTANIAKTALDNLKNAGVKFAETHSAEAQNEWIQHFQTVAQLFPNDFDTIDASWSQKVDLKLRTLANKSKEAQDTIGELENMKYGSSPVDKISGMIKDSFKKAINRNKGENDFSTSPFLSFEEFNEKAKSVAVKADEKTNSHTGMFHDIFDFDKHYEQTFFKTRESGYDPSTIVVSRMDEALTTRGILSRVYALLGSYKDKFSTKLHLVDDPEDVTIDRYTKFDEMRVRAFYQNGKTKYNKVVPKDNAKTFGEVVSNTVISKMQDAGETIGIQRLDEGKTGTGVVTPFKNFFQYRVAPIFGLAAGAIAVNSFSDMIVPDDAPIIGNGVVGVGTRAYATARVGLQYGLKYTGILGAMRSIESVAPGVFDNGLLDFFDPLMDPSEMIDVYFKGKPVEVKKNRHWFTAGRQSAAGEEFGQYRPHLLYTMGNPTSGIYDDKVTKFFRKDFLPTKYLWYLADPYKEERDAYKNLGVVHPKTEQLFKDIPVIGHFLSATLGEVIKPTKYINADEWRVKDGLMKNPNYNPNDPFSPEYMEYTEPNRLVESFFEAVEDLKTWSGLPGYVTGKLTESVFGKLNPYEDKVTLSSLDRDTSYYRSYDKLQAGGMFGMTEPIRRLLDDGNKLGTIAMNPLTQKLPDWMPDYFRKGNHLYSSMDFAEYMLPSKAFDSAGENAGRSEEMKRFRILSMIAPKSKEFKQLNNQIYSNLNQLSDRDKKYYFESMGYANSYGERDYENKFALFSSKDEISVKVKKKIAVNEFIGDDNKRYKIDTLSDDFNKLSQRIGGTAATKAFKNINDAIKVGGTYQFSVAQNPVYSVGTDDDGEYIKVDSSLVRKRYISEDNAYRNRSKGLLSGLVGTGIKLATQEVRLGAGAMDTEKVFGRRSAFEEWSYEAVQTPYFRDWDNAYSAFIEPYYNLSANNILSYSLLSHQANEAFLDSNTAQINLLGSVALTGAFSFPVNKLLGRISVSGDYKDDTKIQNDIEKIKYISGEKSYYNMKGNESLKQFSKMLNEQDAVYLEGLVNISNESERAKVLKTANPRMKNILQTIWNRQASYLNNTEAEVVREELTNKDLSNTPNIGAYTGNVDDARNLLKASYGISLSKLDNKRFAIIDSYRGGISQKQGEYIARKMYGNYGASPYITSTISPVGNINITQRRSDRY